MVEGQAIQQVADGASIKAAPERGSGGIEEFVQSLMPSGFGQGDAATRPGFTQGSEGRPDTISGENNGVYRLNTGDSFSHVNGTETVVTKQGDMLSVNGRNGALQLMADGARIEQLNPDTGKYETIKQLPSGFGQGMQIRVTFQNGTVVTAEGNMNGGRITSVARDGNVTQFERRSTSNPKGQ